jgi:hypothetical protein
VIVARLIGEVEKEMGIVVVAWSMSNQAVQLRGETPATLEISPIDYRTPSAPRVSFVE